MDKDFTEIKQIVKRELSDFLGITTTDIEDESILSVDFHMGPTELTDFMEILNKAGFETEKVEMTEIETFLDLVDALHDKH